MRALFAPAVGLFLSLSFAAAWAAPVRDQRALQPDGELRVRMEAGRITVRAGTEPQALVEANLFPAQALRWRGDARGLALIIDDGTRLRPRDAELLLTVPAGVRLFLSVGDGAVDAEGVGAAGLVISGGDGDVRVVAAAGTLAASTRAGRIDAELGAADARLSTLSGAVVARSGQGPPRLTVQTLSGAVEVSLAAPERVTIETVSGDVAARFESLQGADVQLESLRGNVLLDVPQGVAASLELDAAKGKVALPPDAAQQPDGSVRLGEGGGRVVMGSFTGGLTVSATRVPARPEAVTPLTPPVANPPVR